MPTVITNQIKFLTPFDVPCSFGVGYPFLLKFITPMCEPIDSLPTRIQVLVNEFVDDAIKSFEDIVISSGFINVESTDVYYPAGEYLNPVLPFAKNEVALFYNDGVSNEKLSETKLVENVCVDYYTSPICLFWLNSLGGWDVWVFNRPEFTTQIKGESYITRPIDDLAIKELGTLITRNETKSFIVSQNNLDENRYKCLKEIVKSPKCFIYYNENEYEQVQISQANFTQKTASELFTINLEVSFFQIFNQF